MKLEELLRQDFEKITGIWIPHCPHCGADLSLEDSVEREYVSKDEGEPSMWGTGHYDSESECYEPDSSTDLGDGNYDLLMDSDRCACCEKKI